MCSVTEDPNQLCLVPQALGIWLKETRMSRQSCDICISCAASRVSVETQCCQKEDCISMPLKSVLCEMFAFLTQSLKFHILLENNLLIRPYFISMRRLMSIKHI